MRFFCPVCFKKLDFNQPVCQYCHTDINKWQEETSYELRLIHSLKHPNSEVRMGAIITLGNMRSFKSAIPLANCALDYPKDIVQNLEILKSIDKIINSNEKDMAIKKLTKHPSNIIRKYIKQIQS